MVEHRRHRPGRRHPRDRARADLRAVLPGRPGPGHGPPVAPVSGCRSSSTSPPPTAARCGSGASRATGSTFTMVLPAQLDDAGDPVVRQATRAQRLAAWAGSPRGGCNAPDAALPREGGVMTRVLVVEDEDSYSDALAYMLRKEGFEVSLAATGPDALAEFERAGRRHRAARPDAARPARHRGMSADPSGLVGARHHGERQGRRGRQGRRPRARSRRLRDQAVQSRASWWRGSARSSAVAWSRSCCRRPSSAARSGWTSSGTW